MKDELTNCFVFGFEKQYIDIIGKEYGESLSDPATFRDKNTYSFCDEASDEFTYLFKLKFDGTQYVTQYCNLKSDLVEPLCKFNEFMKVFIFIKKDYKYFETNFLYNLNPEMVVKKKNGKLLFLFNLYFSYTGFCFHDMRDIYKKKNSDKYYGNLNSKYVLKMKDNDLKGSLIDLTFSFMNFYYELEYEGGSIDDYLNLIEMKTI